MSLRLILMRHMKSSWETLTDDHDRRLNARGIADAPRIGAWLAAQGYTPDTVCVSSAQRTKDTWAGVASAFGDQSKAGFHPELYLAEPDRILQVIQAARGTTLAIIGHNPGIAEAASLMAQTPSAHPQFDRYPTGATTVFDIDATDWRDVTWGQGRIVDFAVPRDL